MIKSEKLLKKTSVQLWDKVNKVTNAYVLEFVIKNVFEIEHNKYGKVKVWMIRINPKVIYKRFFYLWNKISFSHETHLLFTYESESQGKGTTSLPLQSFMRGVKHIQDFQESFNQALAEAESQSEST